MLCKSGGIALNEKMKVMVLGLGNFGHSWATSIVPQCREEAVLAAVVDRRQECWEGIDPDVPRYQSPEEALAEVCPDLVINVTPPAVHTEINRMLLAKNIPVLCEKPIADTLESAMEMDAFLKKTGGFLMIGENYRYDEVIRTARKIVEGGGLGAVRQISCHFRHYHPDYSRFYHGTLAHPLLEDVTIHHLDLARYLSGEEPQNVACREYSAPYCWYGDRPATAHLLSDMTGGSVFRYDGTLASPQSITTWNGDWELQCDDGVVVIRDDRVYVYKDDTVQEVTPESRSEDSRIPMLREACRALREGRAGETDFRDNLRSFVWMRYAIEAANTGKVVPLDMKGE